jgi:hypothetical protein
MNQQDAKIEALARSVAAILARFTANPELRSKILAVAKDGAAPEVVSEIEAIEANAALAD